MATKGRTYVCTCCGQRVTVVQAGAGTLVCCGQPMHPAQE